MNVFILLFALIAPSVAYYYEYSTNIQLKSISRWDVFICRQLRNLVNGKVMTKDQASNILKTYNIRGLGEFRDTSNGTAFDSDSYSDTYSGDQGAAAGLSASIKKILQEKTDCKACQGQSNANGQTPTFKCSDGVQELALALATAAISNKFTNTKSVSDLAESTGIAVTIPVAASPDDCYKNQLEAKTSCDKAKSGVADGMRCFYAPADSVTWAASWDLCKGQGGILAPVLTSYEMLQINTTLGPKVPQDINWYNSYRTGPPETIGGLCTRPYTSTFVYNTATDYNPNLSHNNTWFRTRKCIGEDPASEDKCQHLWIRMTKFADFTCTNANRPVCLLTNPGQNYVRVNDVCLDEVPIVEKAGTKPEDCAGACNSFFWCRSFNLKNGNCQLFPWHVDDIPNMSFKNPSCSYYVYLN